MKCFRLSGFDYSRPFFYLVTLKKLPGLQPFCSIVAPGKVAPTPITAAFEETIRAFAAKWRAVEKIWPCVTMPDHLHLIIKLGVSDKPITLPKLVAVLQRELSRAYWGLWEWPKQPSEARQPKAARPLARRALPRARLVLFLILAFCSTARRRGR